MTVLQFVVLLALFAVAFGNAALRGQEELLAAKKTPAVKRNQPTSEPTIAAVIKCPQLPALNQVPEYGYVSMGTTGRLENFCESPFYFPYKCKNWMTAAQEAQYKVKPDFAIAEHYLEWEDDANGSLAAALTRDLANNVAGQAIVKFVDAFAFASECIVINKHRKKAPIQCLNQCFEPGNWGANQVVYFAKYARGNKIRMNFYMRSSLNSVAITTSNAITTLQGFKTALTYVYNNQAADLQAMTYNSAIAFAPRESEFVNLLAGYPGSKPECSFFDVLCRIVGAPAPKKAAMSKFKITGAGTTDVIESSAGPQ